MDEEISIGHDVLRHAQNSPINDYVAGALGGMVGIIVGHPFDTTKVQLQTQSAATRCKGTMDALKNIKSQGISHGFFRGMSWPLLSYGFVNSIFFGVYGNTLKILQGMRTERKDSYYLDVYIAGSVAGVAQLSVACPVDLIKVILQSQIPHDVKSGQNGFLKPTIYYKGPWEATKALVRQNGIAGCYRGLAAMASRDVPSYGLYCFIYEYLSDKMHEHKVTDERGVVASLFAGGVAGTITWFSIMPFDVMKSRIQADVTGQYKNMLDCCVQTVRGEGIMALYKGTVVTCVRAFPVNAATFMMYSQLLKCLNTS